MVRYIYSIVVKCYCSWLWAEDLMFSFFLFNVAILNDLTPWMCRCKQTKKTSVFREATYLDYSPDFGMQLLLFIACQRRELWHWRQGGYNLMETEVQFPQVDLYSLDCVDCEVVFYGLCLCAWREKKRKKQHVLKCQSVQPSQTHAFIGAKSNNVCCHTKSSSIAQIFAHFLFRQKGRGVNVINSLAAWKVKQHQEHSVPSPSIDQLIGILAAML